MKATFDHVAWDAPDTIATFAFKPEGRFRFTAGQFTELHIAHADPDTRGLTREFSIASHPQDELVHITTTLPNTSERMSTFKRALRALQPGDSVDLAQPMGDFVLPKDPSVPVIFIAGGIGIVPVISIARDLAASNSSSRNIQVLHSVSDPRALLKGASLFASPGLCKQYLPIITKSSEPGFSARITAAQVLQQMNPSPQTLFYISGPEAMVQELHSQLQAAGVAGSRIVADEFSRY